MVLDKYLDTSCIKIGSEAATKEDILNQIAGLSVNNSVLKPFSQETIKNLLIEREKLCSTGIGGGIAIPHCALEKINNFVMGVVTKPEGINFDSIDTKPTKLFFFIIGPKKQRNQHIQILSALSKLLKSPEIVTGIINAQSPEEVKFKILSAIRINNIDITTNKLCLFSVYIQKEELFNDILQIFSASLGNSLAIIESNNASHYLYRMPLFSTYWTENPNKFLRIIIARIDKRSCNEIIRQINMLTDTLDKNPGVMIMVQDLIYSSGTIDF